MQQSRHLNRRRFLQFLRYGAVSSTLTAYAKGTDSAIKISGLEPTRSDQLELVGSLQYELLIKQGEGINAHQRFGSNNDFIAFIKDGNDSATLWVNHEYFNPVFISATARNKINIDLERREVGGSLLKLRKKNRIWSVHAHHQDNMRFDATTPIPFAGHHSILNATAAEGTLANCAGGVTPWKTFLSCEENYQLFYGDADMHGKSISDSRFGW